MSGKTFEHQSLASAVFKDVNLRAAEFDDVCLAGSTFNNINFSSARLTDVDLRNTTIQHAAIDGMQIDGILVTELFAAFEQLHPGKHKHC